MGLNSTDEAFVDRKCIFNSNCIFGVVCVLIYYRQLWFSILFLSGIYSRSVDYSDVPSYVHLLTMATKRNKFKRI